MKDIIGKPSSSVVYLCGSCGSPRVTFGTLLGESAKCETCGWVGPVGQLVAAPFAHDFSTDAAASEAMVVDLRNLLAASVAVPIAKFLVKWGFLSGTPTSKELARYLSAAARGIVAAVVEERGKVVDESKRRVRGVPGSKQ